MKFSQASKFKKQLSIAFLFALYVGVLAYLSRYII